MTEQQGEAFFDDGVKIDIGMIPAGVGAKGVIVKLEVTDKDGTTSVMGALGLNQARHMAADILKMCDAQDPQMVSCFMVTAKLSWTIPGQALTLRFNEQTGWHQQWAVEHNVTPGGPSRAQLKRGSSLILPASFGPGRG